MHPEDVPIQIKPDIAFTSLGLVVLLVGLLIGVGVAVVLARRRLSTSASDTPQLLLSPSMSGRFQFVREFAWLAVPLAVIASFGITTAPREFLSGLGLPTKVLAALAPPSPPPPRVEVATAKVPNATINASGASPRPAWVDQVRVVDGDSEQIVLTSQQYSTKEEAELELRFAASKLVEEDLRRFQSGMFRPKQWRPDADDVVAHAVKRRYDDVNERDFGSFTHPMHRVSWQVELSPAVRTEFIPAWRRELISFRILLVAVVASMFAMVASAGVMYFRLDSLTQGRARGSLKLLTGGLTAGWLMLVVATFFQGHLW